MNKVIIVNKEKVLKIIKELIPYVIILIVVILVRSFLVTPIIVNGPKETMINSLVYLKILKMMKLLD